MTHRIWNESDGDWQPIVNEVRHRMELIKARDGELTSEHLDACIRIGLRLAQRAGMDAAIQAVKVESEGVDNGLVAAALRRLVAHLRSY